MIDKTSVMPAGFLANGGETGRQILEKDWIRTSVGAIDEWPQSLKSAIGIVVNNRFPMFLYWGKDLTFFYNDAFSGSIDLKEKSTGAIGLPGPEALPELWEVVQPEIDFVLQGNGAVSKVDQLLPYTGKCKQEVYSTFSYSPVYDESGSIGGVLVTCIETSENVENLIRLDNAERRFRNILDTNIVFAMILEGPDMCIEMMNEKALMVLNKNKNISNRSFTEVFPELEGSDFHVSIQKVFRTGATISINEVYFEDTSRGTSGNYFDFIYKPFFGADQDVNGVIVIGTDVTENVNSRRRLEESKQQLEFAIEAAGLGTWDYNPFTNKFKSNKRLREWFSLNDEAEIELHHAINSIIQQDRDRVMQAIQNSFNHDSADPYSIRYSIINPADGEPRIVEAKGIATFNEENQPVRFTGILQDVTESVRLLNRAESREQYIRMLIDSAPFPIAVYTGKEMVVEYANDSLIQAWGKGPDVIGKRYADVLPELGNQEVYQQLDGVFTTGITYHAENRLIRLVHNGEEKDFYFNYTFTPLKDRDGHVFGVMNTAADVTALNIANRKIEESEKRFRNVVKQAPLGITILRGRDYIVEMANEVYLQIVGKTEKEFVGKRLYDTLPEVEESIQPILDNILLTGQPFHGIEFPVVLNRYGKSDLSYFNFVYHPLREDDGMITGIMVVASEVTSSVNARRMLEESERQFRNLVLKSPTPMAIFRGSNFIVEMANYKMFNNIWRRKEEDVIGRPLFELFPEVKDQKYPELLNDVFTTGVTYREDEAVAFINGSDGLKKFYIDFECAPLYEKDNTISGIIITMNDVTEKVMARKRVEESEMRFRNIADNAPVFIWMTDANLRYNFYNKAWLNFKGTTLDAELMHKGIGNVHPEDEPRRNKMFAEAFEKKEDFFLDYRVLRYDGEYRWITESAVPRFTIDGDFEGYIGACKDIHERVMNRQKLKENEERLNIVISASELGTWELNLLTSEVNYSNRYMQIFGIKSTEPLTHEELKKRLHPEDLYIREAAFKTAYKTGSLNYQTRIINDDGAQRWVEAKGKVFYGTDGKPEKMIGTIRDITDEIHYQKQLEEREQKFRLLADSMPQHIWTADPSGKMNYFNQSVYNYTGLSFEQLNQDGWLSIIHPDDLFENIRSWKKAVESGTPFHIEHRFRRSDGVYHWQLTRAIPQTDETGKIHMWVGTSTDIQDQKTFTNELESQVNERTKELEQKNKELQKMNAELQSFAYVSSHDLQEPLRKIQTFAARIIEKDKSSLSDTGKDYFRRMQDAANRMQTLIDDLLAYSRTNTTEYILNTVDLNEFITDVKNEFRETITEKGGEVNIKVSGELTVIAFQFRQLLQNIIGNALKFSAPGRSPVINIQSDFIRGDQHEFLQAKKTYCHLEFSDNGIGFDPVYKDRIFEVFQRLHGKDEYTGTGIGLAIVKKIVDNHNGVIMATGEQGRGATFDIYIPVD